MPQNLRPLSKTLNYPRPTAENPTAPVTSGGPMMDTSAVPKAEQDEAVPMDKDNRVLRPARTEYFKNDLSDEDKDTVIGLMVAQAKAALAEPQVTVNTVARMFGMEHNKVKQFCCLSPSLKTFLESRDQSKNVARLSRSISKLTPEERKLLMNQLTSMPEQPV